MFCSDKEGGNLIILHTSVPTRTFRRILWSVNRQVYNAEFFYERKVA